MASVRLLCDRASGTTRIGELSHFSCLLITLIHKQNIIHLWEGSITGIDQALQLILIIDYILDWARDTYRPNVIRQLKCIAEQNASSTITVTNSSQPLSVSGCVPLGDRWVDDKCRQASVCPAGSEASVLNPMYAIEKKHSSNLWTGSVIDGTKLHSHVRGLYITEDNISTLRMGFKDRGRPKDTWKQILEAICRILGKGQKYVMIRSEHLITVKNIWLGQPSVTPVTSRSPSPIVLSIQASFWAAEDFTLWRELSYVAITQQALELLTPYLIPGSLDAKTSYCAYTEAEFLSEFEAFNQASKLTFLFRCLSGEVSILCTSGHLVFDARMRHSGGDVNRLNSNCLQKVPNWTPEAIRGVHTAR